MTTDNHIINSDENAVMFVGKVFTGPWGPPAGAAKKPTKSKAQINREMGFTTGNALQDWVNDVKDGFWDWAHDGSEEGFQAHEVRGNRRVNCGHENVNGWCDDKPARQEKEDCKMQ